MNLKLINDYKNLLLVLGPGSMHNHLPKWIESVKSLLSDLWKSFLSRYCSNFKDTFKDHVSIITEIHQVFFYISPVSANLKVAIIDLLYGV